MDTRSCTVTTLTGMQRKFVEHLLADPKQNATKAARKAGYSNPAQAGHKLTRNKKIRAARDEAMHSLVMSRNEVLARLSAQASAKYSDYMTKRGGIRLKKLLADGNGHLIKSTRQTEFGLEIIFYDAQKALVQVGRYYSLFTDVKEEKSKLPDILEKALDSINGRFPAKI